MTEPMGDLAAVVARVRELAEAEGLPPHDRADLRAAQEAMAEAGGRSWPEVRAALGLDAPDLAAVVADVEWAIAEACPGDTPIVSRGRGECMPRAVLTYGKIRALLAALRAAQEDLRATALGGYRVVPDKSVPRDEAHVMDGRGNIVGRITGFIDAARAGEAM